MALRKPPNVALWLEADMEPPKIDFRLASKTGHSRADVRFSPIYARSSPSNGHSHGLV